MLSYDGTLSIGTDISVWEVFYMELPRNITQIGETNPTCKIYAEDYVISYIKQLNRLAADKGLAVALYGVQKEEGGVTYLFFYGAAKLNFLQRECRHLSQAQTQELEKIRRRHFASYDFLGYRLLDGEMVEGFHVCQQGVCRYITGYAQFYEKNDSMLNFMLEERQGEAVPETVDQSKYQEVKRRQEERRSQSEGQQARKSIYRASASSDQGGKGKSMNFRGMQWAAAAAFVLLGVIGVATISGGNSLEDLQTAVGKVLEDVTTKQLPDAVEVTNGTAQVGTVVAEDRLADAILKENQAAASASGQEGQEKEGEIPDAGSTDGNVSGEPSGTAQDAAGTTASGQSNGADHSQMDIGAAGQGTDGTLGQGGTEGTAQESGETPGKEEVMPPAQETGTSSESLQEPVTAAPVEPVPYVIQKGDTLIGICVSRYGSDDRVAEVCSLNNIENPDDIKVGQKILLP